VSTYTPIASVTLSSAQSSVTFSGIPQTYTDLVLVVSTLGTTSVGETNIRVNGDSGNNYSRTHMTGTGSTATSGRNSNIDIAIIGSYGSSNDVAIAHFMNYSNTTTNKTILARGGGASNEVKAQVNLWRSTAAINSITVYAGAGNFNSGATFNLYGVANASITNTAKATGGDSVTTDGTYWYHTFRTSGTFTPTQALTADYLVVAGGGGGGSDQAGGGGAGGMRCTVTATGGGGSLESALSLTAQAYTVTIGAGGAGQLYPTSGLSGSNSVFSTITATGGGGGAQYVIGTTTGPAGKNGGSGGGASGRTTASGGTGTANQGYAGGNGGFQSSSQGAGAGGGGAGAIGANGGNANGGNGGAGVATSITGSSITYAGGGGGGADLGGTKGTGGSGGGGDGGGVNTSPPTNGTANLGSGGGGGGYGTGGGAAGNGGSGIVIVRYAV
jgi:hypothetical protein